MVEEEREKSSLNLLSVISKTIDRQVLRLATTIAWYNHHRLIVFPKDNLFEVTVGGLRYTGDLERLEDCYNKEEKYWKRFSEKSSEEKRFLTVENLLSDVPSAVKEFVEKNDTTGGGSFSENLDSVGNQNFNKEEESESVKEISPPHKASKKPLHTLEKQFEEEKFIFSQIGQEDVVWARAATQPDSRGDPSNRCDPRLDPVQVTREPHVFHQRPIRGSTRGPLDPVHPYPNWVWTRNPNLGFSSPSEVRFGPFKRRYDQYSEEHYSGGYPNPHFRYKRSCEPIGLIAKELANAGHTLSDKMQVTVVLNSLPPSWDHVVTSLTHSGKELAMTTLPVLLMLEEDRMKKRKRDNASSSLMMAQSSHAKQFKPKNKFKHKRFKKQWIRKPRQGYKPQNVCYRCGEKGHYKINCPLNKRPKNKGKEIAMTITEALVIESPPTSWWVDSAATRHIARNRELFVDLKEKQLGEHRVYMGNNTYSDVLGEDTYTMPYKPQQNGIAERRNRTLMDMMRSMMAYADLQIVFWGEALSTTAYILNRVKTKSKPLTPFEIWTGHQPDMTNLKVWGCKAHVLIPKPLRNKLTYKTWECKFIRYVENGSRYRFFHSDKGLIESRDAVFIEDTKLITPLEQIKKLFHAESEESDPHVLVFSNKDLENSGRKRTSPEPTMSSIDADDSGRKRQMRPSSMLKDYYLMESKAVAIEDDPANFAKKTCWMQVGTEKKYKADGSLDKYKARLVAKGFTQQPGVDFVDTYSPVAKFASVRIIMVVAARLDLELHQLDVKTAFLNGDLKEEIYMDQPDGFQIKGQEGKVCRLKKSLYGLKQSSRQWYLKFHQAILDIGYEMSPLDHCVYVWRDKEKLALLSLYVDDILLASNSPDMMKETKFCLGSKFEMKDMGLANYVLGIRISRDRDSKLIYLDQENYLEKVLKRFKMEDCRPVSTPVSKGTILNKSMCPTNKTELEEMIAVPYAQAVGSLMYAMTSTKPDICYAVGLVSRYQSNPGKAHWQVVKRIFRYLQMTKSMKLCFGLDELEIKGFTDADFAGDTDDRKSTSGYVFLFCGTTVSWLSKKQVVLLSIQWKLSTLHAAQRSAMRSGSNVSWIV
uniref:CCHC-type domain-containing protein n=1 Tax=Fagus sylvatica TaxID=28930 RepID=A0A2N9EKJ9_FAGSY